MFDLFSELWSNLVKAWKRRSDRKKVAERAAKVTKKKIEQIEWGRRIDLGRTNKSGDERSN